MGTMAGGPLSLGQIVARLGGDLIGGDDILIHRVATLQSAGPGDIAFLSHGRYKPFLETTGASAVILGPADRGATPLPRVVSDNPYLYFAQVARLFAPLPPVIPGIHPSAVIAPDAHVSPDAQIDAHVHIGTGAVIHGGVVIGPGCFIGDQALIGRDTRLAANVCVHHDCRLGERGIVHSGAVIGADGFGMARHEGKWLKIPQTGRVIIGDDVEIGANTTIDRGALEDTVIEDGVKLDNQIQIGHNVRVGAHSAFAGCVGIAGSARIGRRCTIGGGAIILGHLEIVDDVHVSAATLVTKSITKPGSYGGAYPFSEQRQWLRGAAALRHIDELVRRIDRLESRMLHGTDASPVGRQAKEKIPGRRVTKKKTGKD